MRPERMICSRRRYGLFIHLTSNMWRGEWKEASLKLDGIRNPFQALFSCVVKNLYKCISTSLTDLRAVLFLAQSQ